VEAKRERDASAGSSPSYGVLLVFRGKGASHCDEGWGGRVGVGWDGDWD
jgi:hypothetical protein